MSHRSRVKALKLASLVVIGFGLLMVTTVFTPTDVILRFFLDLAFLPFDGGQDIASDSGWLMTAITGGVLTGWGATVWLVTTRVYAADPSAGKKIILPGILVWFAVDSLGSILAGAWFNVVMNGIFLAMFAVPILWHAPQSRPQAT